MKKTLSGAVTLFGVPIYGILNLALVKEWITIVIGLITIFAGIQYIYYNYIHHGNVCEHANKCASRKFKKFQPKAS